MQEKNLLATPVRYIKGVGPKKAEALSEIGIDTIEDMLYYLPSRYEDRSRPVNIKEMKVGESQAIRGRILSMGDKTTKTGMRLFAMSIGDGTGTASAIWFRQPYLKNNFKLGDEVMLYGRVELYDRVRMIQPEYEIIKDASQELIHMGRIVPVYPATGELTQKYLRSLIHGVVFKFSKSVEERLPAYIMARQRMVDAKFAVRNIHFPSSFECLEKAYRRIVFEEFFMLQLALAIRRKDIKAQGVGLNHSVSGDLLEGFKKSLPFELTAGQKKTISDIERDMSSGKPMNRLVEGDVGSGKTIVAAYALVMTVQNG
nr:DNA helicase RecG [Candidatus Omnitrophota bacterium]